MPKRQTSFDSEWQKDDRFSAWIARSSTSDSDAYCVLCKKSFSVANWGLYQVLQHQQGTKHSAVVAASKSQPRFRIAVGNFTVESAGTVRIFSHQDQVSRAEILCLLRMVKHSHSFASCDDLALTL